MDTEIDKVIDRYTERQISDYLLGCKGRFEGSCVHSYADKWVDTAASSR